MLFKSEKSKKKSGQKGAIRRTKSTIENIPKIQNEIDDFLAKLGQK